MTFHGTVSAADAPNGCVAQNDGVVGIGRDLGRSSSPIPLPEQEHLGQVTQELIVSLDVSEQSPPHSSSYLFPMLGALVYRHPPSKVCFLPHIPLSSFLLVVPQCLDVFTPFVSPQTAHGPCL